MFRAALTLGVPRALHRTLNGGGGRGVPLPPLPLTLTAGTRRKTAAYCVASSSAPTHPAIPQVQATPDSGAPPVGGGAADTEAETRSVGGGAADTEAETRSEGAGAGNGGDAPRTPIPGGPYDGVTLQPYEHLMVDRYGDERIRYVGKDDPRPLTDLDFKELLSGKYYSLKMTEDQIYAYIFDTVAGVKKGKPENFEEEMRKEMKKLDPDTFGRFGSDFDDDLETLPPKTKVFKLDSNGRPVSHAFFTTAPVYYEELDRLKTVLARLDTEEPVPVPTPEAATAEAAHDEGDTAETDDHDSAGDAEVKKRPVIAGENRVLTWDEKQELLEADNGLRAHPSWVDDNGTCFWDKSPEDEHAEMIWLSFSQLVKKLGSPLGKAQYRRLLRYAKLIKVHPKFDTAAETSLAAYQMKKPKDRRTKAAIRPLDRLGQAYATGRKKHATAVVYLKPGTGQIRINKMDIVEFCGTRLTSKNHIVSPFISANNLGEFDADCIVRGGGPQGQVIACRHGIAKAIENYTFNTKSEAEGLAMRKLLKSYRLLQRDPRMVERRKAGQHGARAKKRWTKR